MAVLANVALTNTFDTWRLRTNALLTRVNQFTINESAFYANTLTANVRFVSTGSTRLGTTGSNRTIVNGLLTVNGNITISGNTSLNGNINLGDASTDLLTVTGRASIGQNLTVSGNTVLGAAGKTANVTGWFGVTGRQSISTNLFVGANAYVMGSFGVGTKQPTSPGGTVNIVANTSGSAIIKSQTTSTTTGTARFDLATGTGSSYAILGLNDNTGSPYLSLGVGSGVLNTYYDSPTHIFRLVSGTEIARFTNGGLKVTANTTLAGTTTDNSNARSQTLTDGATISWDTSLGRVATVTLAGNRAVAAPTNLKIGTYILNVIQDATGSRTLTWNAVFKWTGGVAPVLTTTANARDVFSFFSDGTNLYGSYLPDVK